MFGDNSRFARRLAHFSVNAMVEEVTLKAVVAQLTSNLGAAVRREPLPGGSGPLSPEVLRTLVDLFSDPSITGFSFGEKHRRGQSIAGTRILRVYVVAKRPEHELLRGAVPRSIVLADGEILETDVVAIGAFEAQDGLVPGASVGHPEITAGTLGCVVQRTSDDQSHYLLSCFHVLANDGAASLGAPVLHPATADGGDVTEHIVARLAFIVPYDFDGFTSRVDAALALLGNSARWANSWLRFGNPIQPNGLIGDVSDGQVVHKIGRTSGLTSGKVVDAAGVTLKVSHRRPGGTERIPVIFSDQVVATKYADGGDSGSVVFSDSGSIVGLHMSGNDEYSVFNRAETVWKLLGIRLAATAYTD